MATQKPPAGSFPWQHIPSPGKVYGTATVGERGQVAIPAEARRELGLNSGDKVIVFGNKLTGAVTLIKADIFEDFATFFSAKLGKLGEHAGAFVDYFTHPAEDGEPETEPVEAEVAEAAAAE
jgi:AbrB family looped-hinge helix DNA binding protein